MPKPRFIRYADRDWQLTDLARHYHIAPGTLRGRLGRFGETATGISRSLATGIMTRADAGKVGASRSPWRYGG